MNEINIWNANYSFENEEMLKEIDANVNLSTKLLEAKLENIK